MYRVLSTLLIPIVLLGQGIGLGHSHEECGVAEPLVHSSRPHFHAHGHRHCHQTGDHEHADTKGAAASSGDTQQIRSAMEHDADAIYLSVGCQNSDPRSRNRISGRVEKDFSVLWHHAAVVVTALTNYQSHCQPPPICEKRPIYLRTHSILC